VVALLAVLPACVPVTVNVTFPQQKLDDAASQIVDMSRRPEGAPPPEPAPATPKPGSSLDRWLAPLAPREAVAQEHHVAQTPRTDSPELRRLAESQNQRLGALKQSMTGGASVRVTRGSWSLGPGRAAPVRWVGSSGTRTGDRQAIVDTFMRQDSIPASDAGRVRTSFAGAYRDRAPGGAWIQTDRGEWIKK
jgi:hypothetical protein